MKFKMLPLYRQITISFESAKDLKKVKKDNF